MPDYTEPAFVPPPAMERKGPAFARIVSASYGLAGAKTAKPVFFAFLAILALVVDGADN
jgi:hypothetical protein